MAKQNGAAGDEIADAAGEMKQRAAEGADALKRAAQAKAEETTQEIGERVDRVADAVQSAGSSLRGQEDWLADAADSLGRSIHDMSNSARQKGFSGLKSDVERFAHEQPLLFMGAAVMVGLAVGRLMRSAPPGASARDDLPGRDSQEDAPYAGRANGAEPGTATKGPDVEVGAPHYAGIDERSGTV
ncbi:MAG: hypothetical protein RIM84_07735 [Alphaproteobacteria bacterium]